MTVIPPLGRRRWPTDCCSVGTTSTTSPTTPAATKWYGASSMTSPLRDPSRTDAARRCPRCPPPRHPGVSVGKGGFEPPASASRTLRANQAALLPGSWHRSPRACRRALGPGSAGDVLFGCVEPTWVRSTLDLGVRRTQSCASHPIPRQQVGRLSDQCVADKRAIGTAPLPDRAKNWCRARSRRRGERRPPCEPVWGPVA
jgi:hypothetical protein